MKRNIITIEGIAIAQEPIHQGGDRGGGTVGEFRRELTRVGDEFEYLPVVSANSIGGILRDQCAFWCLDQIEYEQFTGREALRAFDVLTSGGGRVVKVDDPGYIDLFKENELRSLFPVISLFGGSIGNRMLQGRIEVGNWVPLCAEMQSRLPRDLWERAARWHIEDLLFEASFSTRDDKKSRIWQDRIAPDTLSEWLGEQEAADIEKTAKRAPISMRYAMESLAAGTEFYVLFRLHNPTNVELGAFFGGLSYFHETPKIGGRANRGFGKVALDLKQFTLTGFTKVEGPLAIETMEAASEHLRANRDQIVQLIESGL